MVREGPLMPIQYDANANRGVGFRSTEGRFRDSGANCRAEGREREREEKEKERKRDKENQSLNTRATIVTSIADDDNSPNGGSTALRRHQEAYARMIKDARPLTFSRRSPELESEAESEPLIARNTKRRKIGDAVALDATSSFRPVSPSEDDSGGEETTQGVDAGKAQRRWDDVDADVPLQSLEEEAGFAEIGIQKPPNPVLVLMLEELRPRFPDHDLLVDGDFMKCLECDGKLFRMPIKFNFERHLKTKVHLANMELRRRQGFPNPNRYPPSISARTSLGNFSMDAQERGAAFVPPGRSKLSEVGAHFFQMLQNEGQEKSLQMNLLDHRLTVSEKKTAEQIRGINEKLDDVEKKSIEETQLLSESVKASEEHNESEIKEVHVKVDGVERRLDDRFLTAEEMILELKKSEQECLTAMLNMGEASRESKKNQEDFQEMIADKMANYSGKLTMIQQKTKETVDAITDRVAKADSSNKVKEINQRLRYHKEQVDEIEGKQRDLKKAVEALEAQAEFVGDLEVQVQMLTEQVKGHSTSEEQMALINEHIRTESKDTRERLSVLEIENEERQKEPDKCTLEKFVTLEKEMGERLVDLQESYTSDIGGLLKVFEKQKEKLTIQEALLASTNDRIQRQNDMLERYSKTLELQNQVIKAQNQRLAENDRILKDHSRRLARQEEVSKHLRMTVPAFMTDVQMLNDKIEDHIDENREREIARENERRKGPEQAAPSRRPRVNRRVKMRRSSRRKLNRVVR